MRVSLALSAAALLFGGAGPLAGEGEDWARIGHGRALFITNCVPCHGGMADGVAEGSHRVARERLDLTRIAERNGGRFDELAVYHHVYGVYNVPLGGEREMPVWGRVIARTRDRGPGWAMNDCVSLVAYLEYIQDHPPAPPRE